MGLAAVAVSPSVAQACDTCRIFDPNWQPAAPAPARSAPTAQTRATPQPAAPAVSDSQRTIRRGDRFIYVLNKLDARPHRAVFYTGGRYIDDESAAVNIALRDHYSGATADMKRGLLDFMFLTYQELGLSAPFFLVSGYRSPATNEMLRRRSLQRNGGTTGVARNSPHIHAIAGDLRAPGRSTTQLYRAARSASAQLGYGGVGRYSSSRFVHIDGNDRRTWGT